MIAVVGRASARSWSRRPRRPPTRARRSTRSSRPRRGRARPGPAGPGQPRTSAARRQGHLPGLPAGLGQAHQPAAATARSRPRCTARTTAAVPNGWVHNLEHGGLVLLYSCDKGACDDAVAGAAPRALRRASPASADLRHAARGRRARSSRGSSRCRPSTRRWSGIACCTWTTLDIQQVYDFFTPVRRARRPRALARRRRSRSARPRRRAPSPGASPSAAGEPAGRPSPRRASTEAPAASAVGRPEPVGELRPPMRLYAYEDRSGNARSGCSSTAGCLTGGQLEKRGRILGRLDTHLGLGPTSGSSTTGAARSRRPTRRALRRGAPLVDPDDAHARRGDRRRRLGGKVVCVGLNYGDHVAEGGRAAPGPPAAVREVRQRDHRRRRGDRPAAGHARPGPRGGAGRRHRAAGAPGRRGRRHGPRRGLRRRQRRQRPRLAGQPAGPARGREGRRPVAAGQGQRHLPAGRPGVRHAPTSSIPRAGLAPPQLADPRQRHGRRASRRSCRTAPRRTCCSASPRS